MKKFWTDASDAQLADLIQSGERIRKIGEIMGVSHESARRRALHLGLWHTSRQQRQKQEIVASPQKPNHLEAYKSARRGFSIPAHLEGRYFDLLKSGMSIAEARQELEIITNAED